VRWLEGHVAEVRITRGPHNFFDVALIKKLAEAYESLADDRHVRCILLTSDGRNFCAGADFRGADPRKSATPPNNEEHLYDAARRLFDVRQPVVAVVQGKAVGGGVGLALTADFRVGSPTSRMAANFARLGSHHGFGLSSTLPRVVGYQRALELLLTGRWLDAAEGFTSGMYARLSESEDDLYATGYDFAREIAKSGPLAVASILDTMRAGRSDGFKAATDREKAAQSALFPTLDRVEGVRASLERRDPQFTGE
jgi:Enoyl-CoA hydratase/carnithine racemase